MHSDISRAQHCVVKVSPEHQALPSKDLHTGSSFDSFLVGEGIRDAVEAVAAKRVIAWKQAGAGIPSENPPATDEIKRPHHYARWAIEPITFIMANDLPFCVGNVIKYVLRYDAKNGREDLNKARRYIDMILEQMDRKEAGTDKDVVGRPL